MYRIPQCNTLYLQVLANGTAVEVVRVGKAYLVENVFGKSPLVDFKVNTTLPAGTYPNAWDNCRTSVQVDSNGSAVVTVPVQQAVALFVGNTCPSAAIISV